MAASLRDWLMPDGRLISRDAAMMRNPPRPPRNIPLGPPVPRAVLMDKLRSAGFTQVQAAALVGNMQTESSFIANNVNDKEGAHGLIQWRDERGGKGGRFTDLQNYAAKQGTHWSDVDTQVGFIKHEMGGKERQNAARFMNATTVEEANAGLRRYIRYGAKNEGARLANARVAAGEKPNPAAAAAYAQQQQPSRVANAPAVKATQAAVKDPAAGPQRAPQASPPGAAPTRAAASPQTRLRVTPGQRTAGDAMQAATMGPSTPSKLAAGIIAGYGPAGRDLSTYVEPATGNEILTGSINGNTIMRNLGKTTGAGQKPAALQTAVKQAVAPSGPAGVPTPRPRPPGADYNPETSFPPYSYYGTDEMQGGRTADPDQAFNPTPYRDQQEVPLTGGKLTKPLEHPSNLATQPFGRTFIPDAQVEPRGFTPSAGPSRLLGTPSPPLYDARQPGTTLAPEPGFTPGTSLWNFQPAPNIAGSQGLPGPTGPMPFPPPPPTTLTDINRSLKGDSWNMPPPVSSVPTTTVPGQALPATPPPVSMAPPMMPPILQWWQLPGGIGGIGGFGGGFSSMGGGGFDFAGGGVGGGFGDFG